MKCPVCPGEIEVIENKYDSLIVGLEVEEPEYTPKCNNPKCILSTIRGRFYSKEAALEAMRPVVTDELVSFIYGFIRRQHIYEKNAITDEEFFNQKVVMEMQEYIKQELEKFRNKE